MNLKLYALLVCLAHVFLEGSAIPVRVTSDSNEVDNEVADFDPFRFQTSPMFLTLHSETGYNLVIYRDNVAASRRSANNINELLEIRSVGIGLATIIGAASDSYLAMNSDGDVYSSPHYTPECAFEESLTDDNFRTYRSHRYKDEDWYLAIDRNGNVRKGSGGRKTHFIALKVEWSTRGITRL
ncbi:fibroblast growth factor 1-like [Ptychodera flava]|uniref:fibroblast growth factor 1-like n=1 Tax=Ptychodera flava TaxID=63121 RepID=UPI00396AA850